MYTWLNTLVHLLLLTAQICCASGVDNNQLQIDNVRQFMHGLDETDAAQLRDRYRCMSIGMVRSDPVLMSKIKGTDIWSFTGNCGPFGCARGNTLHGLTGLDDPDSSAYAEMLVLLRALHERDRPKCILLENIKAFVSNSPRLRNKCKGMGDGVWWLHELADLGFYLEVHIPKVDGLEVPQNRERVMVAGFRCAAHHCMWVSKGAPLPVSGRPPLNSIFQSREHLGDTISQYAVDARQVDLYAQTVGFRNGHVLVDRLCEGVGPTLRASYQPARTIPNLDRKEIPYGLYLQEDDGVVRMLTEVECGMYMGLTMREAQCLPSGPNSYFALGNAVVVHVAEQFVQQALDCMEKPSQTRAVRAGQWGTAQRTVPIRRPEFVRSASRLQAVRTIWVTR